MRQRVRWALGLHASALGLRRGQALARLLLDAHTDHGNAGGKTQPQPQPQPEPEPEPEEAPVPQRRRRTRLSFATESKEVPYTESEQSRLEKRAAAAPALQAAEDIIASRASGGQPQSSGAQEAQNVAVSEPQLCCLVADLE